MFAKLAILTVLIFNGIGSALAHADDVVAKNKEQAKKLVTMVFPASTRDTMFKVVGCETGQTYNPYAHNRSGASGYFQILSGHNGTTYKYNGISITVDSSRLFDPMYNTLVAYLMSNGGTNLSPWYSSRSCWAY